MQAQDNGHPSLSSTLTVYCNVIDLNDNAPVFDPMSYSNEIYENVPIGTEVVTVSATDTDSGELKPTAFHIIRSDNIIKSSRERRLIIRCPAQEEEAETILIRIPFLASRHPRGWMIVQGCKWGRHNVFFLFRLAMNCLLVSNVQYNSSFSSSHALHCLYPRVLFRILLRNVW